jgi:predicted phage terminase large subunit-like protein
MTPTHCTIQLRPLHPAQARIRAEAKRFNVVSCGRRFGKTDFGLDEAIDGPKGLLEGYPVGWFAPNSRFFEEAWNAAVRLLEPIIDKKQEQKKRITLVNGAVLEFWDLEDPDAGRSRKYGKVIIDEAAKVPKLELAWDQAIMPTLIDYAGNAWFLSSPKGFNFFKKLHDRGGHLGDPEQRRAEWMSWTFTSFDNPHIQREEIERIASEMPQLVRDQEIMGQFVDLAGASVQREWVKYGAMPPGEPGVISMGVDLAISTADTAAYTAIVTLARLADGRIFVLDVRRFRAAFHTILKEIQRAAEEMQPQIIAIEQVQFQAAVVQELLRTTKLPVQGVTVNKDKLMRFQPVLARYEQGLVHHVPGLPKEFEDELFAFPLGHYKDQCDALGLAYASLPSIEGGHVVSMGEFTDWRFTDPTEEQLEGMTMIEIANYYAAHS